MTILNIIDVAAACPAGDMLGIWCRSFLLWLAVKLPGVSRVFRQLSLTEC